MSKTTYKVTVEKTEHDVPYTKKEWHQLVDTPDDKHPEIYGYVTTDSIQDVTTTVFEQRLDNLDLARLVLTINASAEKKKEANQGLANQGLKP